MHAGDPCRATAAAPVAECGEPLVDVAAVAALTTATPGLRLRDGVADRLVIAQMALPPGCRLVLVTGHDTTPGGHPCHRTGAAVTVRLRAPGVTAARWTGRTLTRALTAGGLIRHPGTSRHWSYGDACWARATGAQHARYGPTDLRTQAHTSEERT
ncbi:hypothetical protein [Actinoplanes teichomyceticus]|uniref:Uncharacterized protein n=1 Tax=Actinoplanes teichomyceticus TaxID=1867 RepID=A0A561VIZ8_ACTTI|nr:hypothetical protein [Actinoplanes teichomyceticus]TWG11582.1 hypothetical protein FHX34_106312 [Actinoplanes teichomyceticus]GIF16027.1 hypothetical protein Ate01nite_60590 [Actinoplanes teichomyceticus]